MLDQDKSQLIEMTKRMFCTECGEREHELIKATKEVIIDSVTYIIHNVPTMQCKHCNALSYPSFAYDYIDEYKNKQINQ